MNKHTEKCGQLYACFKLSLIKINSLSFYYKNKNNSHTRLYSFYFIFYNKPRSSSPCVTCEK
ncbi:hypothetical protein HMPREF9065_00397 [Aggregatibacter sp. oral taxon 458 str. W10330]|nr:hypothetical protein HMPREF9065_00397 [Aggregatibacter sp. oral taxon 458 str. W10330]